jgi:hypothetical protein
MKYTINNRSGLFLPGAESVAAFGSDVEVSAETEKNAAVAGWIKSGLLVKPKDFAKPVSPTADVAQLTADLEASNAANAELQAKVDQLTADLEAATKPAA